MKAKVGLLSGWLYIVAVVVAVLVTGCSPDDTQDDGRKQTEAKYYIATTATKSYSTEQIKSLVAEVAGTADYNSLIPSRDVTVDAITYHSTTPDGKTATLSGTVSYPTDKRSLLGIVVAMHGTIGSNAECPTSTMMPYESILSMLGYVVVEPDMIGFGATSTLPHPYTHYTSMGNAGCDLYFATEEYMTNQQIETGSRNYAIGYSEGGYGAMAVVKMAQKEHSDKIAFNCLIAGGGPYDLTATMDKIVTDDYTGYPFGVAATVVGLNYADQLGNDLSKIFYEPLVGNYTKWFVEKSSTAGQVNAQLSNRPSELVDLSKINASFTASLASNSLVDGWTPKTPILLVHATDDSCVPFVNAQTAFDKFKAAGCSIELKTGTGDHAGGVKLYVYQIALKMFAW